MSQSNQQGHLIAAALLEIRALTVSPKKPFGYSGGFWGPMYCDNRITLSYPHVRELIARVFESMVLAQGALPDSLVAVATAGIPHAAWLSHRLQLPMAYVRAKPKKYGGKNMIEGRLEHGQRTALVEDVVATGRSALRVVETVQKATGKAPEAVYCVFSYEFPGVRGKFASLGSQLLPICDLGTLVREAYAQSLIDRSEMDMLFRFQQDPFGWSNKYKAQLG